MESRGRPKGGAAAPEAVPQAERRLRPGPATQSKLDQYLPQARTRCLQVGAAVLLLALPVMSRADETASALPAGRAGVLVVAHGGNSQWDSTVRKIVRDARLDAPVETVFGMGMHANEVQQFQKAVERLERKSIDRLIVVPLLISSHSEVFRQYAYLFGLQPTAPWPEAGKPLALHVPVVIGQTLDQSTVLGAILLDRAQAIRRGENDAVVLVAHGPNEDADNQAWLNALQQLGQTIKTQGPFREVVAATMRDDAPVAIHEQAGQTLRKLVQTAHAQGRVLVVPVLLARGGVERKIPKLLAGLTYVYQNDTVLPDPRVAQWIAQQVERLSAAPSGS